MVVVMVWVAPWADEVLESGAVQYLELDASYRVLPPHARIVPLALIVNYGIQPGLTLAARKRVESSELFFIRLFDLNQLPVKAIE
jgi:hypothetical protein